MSSAPQLNSPGLALQTHVGCVTVVRLTLVEGLEKIGTMLDQPSQQRTLRLQRDSRLLFQEVFEGPRKSVHRLATRSTSPLLLLSPLGDASGTISPCQLFLTAPEGNIAGLLM